MECYYCGKYGHIRPYCFKLYGCPQAQTQSQVLNANSQHKKKRKPQESVHSLIKNTSLKVSLKEDWYFDSGCSRHMTGVKNFLVDLKAYSTSYVTFGDGAKGDIKGIGMLVRPGSPYLDDVLLVEGLTANLISISKLCDQGLSVKFSKSECLVTNYDKKVLMKGTRSKDNYYMWTSQEKCQITKCLISKEEEVKL